jgi:hypothetical protein
VIIARLLPLLILASVLACEDRGSSQTLYYDGDHLEVHASAGLEACSGTFPYMEAWLSAFRERVGRADSTVRHTFYWMSPEEFEMSPCGDAVACARSQAGVIYSSIVPIEHELVHTELEKLPPSVLREGAAEVFGCTDHYTVLTRPSIEELADERQIHGLDYQAAGRFSRLLIDRFGIDAYLELYAALDGVEGRAGFEAGVVDVLGADLPTLAADFHHRMECRQEAWRFYDVECLVEPPEPWRDGDHWTTTVDLSCDAPDVIGPREGRVWTTRTLEIADGDRYALSVESDDSAAAATIYSCQAVCVGREPSWMGIPAAAVGYTSRLDLEPGRYWLRIERTADSHAPVTVRLKR